MKALPGMIKKDMRARSAYEYYTITAWDSKASMLQFRNSGAHLESMRITKTIATKADAINFEADEFPTWNQAFEMMDQHQANRRK